VSNSYAAYSKSGKYDEEGSDGNLATYLVRDAAKAEYTTAIVVSNDSDLVEPLRVVRSDFGVDVYLINPQRRAVAELSLAACQLPLQLTDGVGTVTKPTGW